MRSPTPMKAVTIDMRGILIKAISGFYYVKAENAVYECKARGNLRKAGVSPIVGDSVEITVTSPGLGVLESVYPRKNQLKRPAVANIDKLIIVSSFSTPAPDTLMIDRLSALAVYSGIKPVIVFNKCDQGDFSEFHRIYANAGFPVYTVSAETGEGLSALKNEFFGCICAMAGNSGVGKSSLINALFGGLELETGAVSEKLGRGRHTTRHTQLFSVENGGFVADTPGFSSVEPDRNYDFKERLAECFPEFAEFSDNCRFGGCSHTCEKGCAVLEAEARGLIEPSRLKSYQMLYNEFKELKPWENKR